MFLGLTNNEVVGGESSLPRFLGLHFMCVLFLVSDLPSTCNNTITLEHITRRRICLRAQTSLHAQISLHKYLTLLLLLLPPCGSFY